MEEPVISVPPGPLGITDSNSTNGNFSCATHFCKQVLLQQIGQVSVRIWDVAILVPNILFLLFLIYKFNRIRAKLTVTRSPVFKAFFVLVYITTIVNIIRCIVSMSISATDIAGEYADKILWLVLKFFLISAELCVLTFGLLFGHLDSRTSIRHVLAATLTFAFVYSGVQALMELKYPDNHWKPGVEDEIDLYGHGGMIFWMASSAIIVCIYTLVCILPWTSCRHNFQLPTKRSFYVYCGFLAILNGCQVAGAAMIFRNENYGFCVVDITTYVYFAFYTPMVYVTFLRRFVASPQPGLLFSYRPQKDEAGAGELPDSGTYCPGFPGITSPSYDDLLYQPYYYDQTDLNSPLGPNPLYNYDDLASSSSDVTGLGNGVLVIRSASGGDGDQQQRQRSAIA